MYQEREVTCGNIDPNPILGFAAEASVFTIVDCIGFF